MFDLVPIIAIIMVFGTPIACLAILMNSLHRRKQMQMEMVNKLIEAGQPVPEALFTGGYTSANQSDQLYKRSMYLLWVGGAIFLALFFIAGLSIATLALIPLAIGGVNYKLWEESVKREKEKVTDSE
ncbi:DUF6249 domain-containing protein [Gilvimarinus sp. SDUM040013]|uniref:DUF6249 domain-containing protein n=1 Tax=Gilvimarinus gilvus TaxID=3058038 RepID=A0ABU4RZG2_9GAMM|nr:DUF6249 domain-containing protein [Gilvimarinus sp. SDUM040013]MDO3384666.1 DUF6249 domain-containing protein [Gilvimarinus sp. SDUM040013]MDX6850252.1 DUF6249 domain-containing protein [Gilvimarinus sp. SDUM040013]